MNTPALPAPRRFLSLWFLALAALLLSACGGGGDGGGGDDGGSSGGGTTPLTITAHPLFAAVSEGAPASFSVSVSSSVSPSYQWQRNGSNIPGATTSTYVIPATALGDNGASFRVVVTAGSASVTSNPATLLVRPRTPPAISTPPANVTVMAGESATFTVSVSGSGPLQFQWNRNGIPQDGATNQSFTLNPANLSDSGTRWSVTVSNDKGSVTSAEALLTVTPVPVVAPTITQPPEAMDGYAGRNLTFRVSVTGSSPLSYDWYKDDVLVSTTSVNAYTFTPALADDGSQWRVTVSNSAGSAASSNVPLRIDPAPGASTFAGVVGNPGNNDGTPGRFTGPAGLARDNSGNIYVADAEAHVIRKITPAGEVSTIAGSPGVAGADNGSGSSARFFSPVGIAVDASGNLYVADAGNHSIRLVSPGGVVTTLAGFNDAPGHADGPGVAARFRSPFGVALGPDGHLYVADNGNAVIRRITLPDGIVSTYAGGVGQTGDTNGDRIDARFSNPSGLAFDADGNLLVADIGGHLIRRITPAGVVSTVAGQSGTTGSTDGGPNTATLNSPVMLAVGGSGAIYITEFSNNTVRRLRGSTLSAYFRPLDQPLGIVAGDGDTLYVSSKNAIIRITP